MILSTKKYYAVILFCFTILFQATTLISMNNDRDIDLNRFDRPISKSINSSLNPSDTTDTDVNNTRKNLYLWGNGTTPSFSNFSPYLPPLILVVPIIIYYLVKRACDNKKCDNKNDNNGSNKND